MGWIRNLRAKRSQDRSFEALEGKIKTLERGFQQLEHDSEEMWESVRKALGRISRLKRDVVGGKIDGHQSEGQQVNQGASPDLLSPSDRRAKIYRDRA